MMCICKRALHLRKKKPLQTRKSPTFRPNKLYLRWRTLYLCGKRNTIAYLRIPRCRTSCRVSMVSDAKEPYMYAKHSCTYAKEPCISEKRNLYTLERELRLHTWEFLGAVHTGHFPSTRHVLYHSSHLGYVFKYILLANTVSDNTTRLFRMTELKQHQSILYILALWYTYVCVCICMHVYVWLYMYTYTYMYIYIYMCIRINMCILKYIYAYVNINIYVYVHIYICM